MKRVEDKERGVKLKKTPFYNYLMEMKPKIEELCPSIKHLELVAFVQ